MVLFVPSVNTMVAVVRTLGIRSHIYTLFLLVLFLSGGLELRYIDTSPMFVTYKSACSISCWDATTDVDQSIFCKRPFVENGIFFEL